MIDKPSYYIYLISSLPMLHFGMRPPFSFERFLEICQSVVSEADLALLKTRTSRKLPKALTLRCNFRSGIVFILSYTMKKWQAFDTALRNELVKIRAVRKRVDAAKYLRPGEYDDPALSRIASNAHRNPSLLEAEQTLDRARWSMLDELSLGHYFDLDFLIIYASKLLILERWERIRSADKSQALENLLQKA